MSLVEVSLPAPAELRGGWAAVCAARGWTDSAWADGNAWFFHDGGGNWATLRFAGGGQAVLIGYDHEYTETYFREAAVYLQEPETTCWPQPPHGGATIWIRGRWASGLGLSTAGTGGGGSGPPTKRAMVLTRWGCSTAAV